MVAIKTLDKAKPIVDINTKLDAIEGLDIGDRLDILEKYGIYSALGDLKDVVPKPNLPYSLLTSNGLVGYSYVVGDFSGKADDQTVIALNRVAITSGALVSTSVRNFVYNIPPSPTGKTADTKIAKIAVDIDDFPRLPTETDYAGQADRACRYCAKYGTTLRLSPKPYPGARIEVHGSFSVEGNGAWVDYLGMGTTLVGGSGQGFDAIQTPWTYDISGYTVDMYEITGATKSSSVITFKTTPNFKKGDILFLSGLPCANSSSGPNGDNYISRFFGFYQVKDVNGLAVTLCNPLKEDYSDPKCRAFYTKGMAVDCTVSGLTITTNADAYQYVVRSAYGGGIFNCRFAGNCAVGASTFTGGGFRCSNWTIDGSYGGISCARGTEEIIFENIVWKTKSGDTNAQALAVFVEESCYNVYIDKMRARGGAFVVGSMNMIGPNGGLPATKRRISITSSVFDTRLTAMTNFTSGTAPFQGGTAAGVDILVDSTIFMGVPTTPDPNQAPGITDAALCWLSGNALGDTVTFTDSCMFISTGVVEAFKSGSAGQGKFLISESARYLGGAVVPQAKWTPRGAWVDFSGQLNSKTPPSGAYSLPAYRRPEGGRDVYVDGQISTYRLESDGTTTTFISDGEVVTNFPSYYRPKTDQIFMLSGFGGADQYQPIPVTAMIKTNGDLIILKRNGATSLRLRCSYCLDW